MSEEGAMSPREGPPGGAWRVLLALFLYLSLAVAITVPVVFSPSELIIGDAKADVWKHLWGHDWVERSLLDEHRLPTEATNINYPSGGSLYPVDLLNGLLMIPLRHLFGHVLGFNLLTWLHLALGGLAMFLLARRFMGSTLAPLLAGFIYGFSPLVLSYGLASGVSNRLNLAWIPLFLIFFFRLLERGRIRDALGAGLAFFLTALGCWTYALLLYLFVFFFCLYLLAAPVLTRRKKGGRTSAELKRLYLDLLVKRLLPLAAICAVAAAPFYLMASSTSTGDHALVKRYSPGIVWDGEDLLTDVRVPLRHALLPLDSNLLVGIVKDKIYKSNYLGYSILLLAFFSLYSRRRYIRFFFPASLFFFLLSQGPYLSFSHQSGGVISPLYFLLVSVVPFMHTLNAIWQFSLLTALCLAIAAGVGLEVLLGRVPVQRRALVAWGSVLAVTLEMLFLSPALMPIPCAEVRIPAVYETLAQDPEPYAIFDYPQLRSSEGDLDHSEYFYFQILHKKPIPYGIERQESWINADPFWVALKRYHRGFEDELPIEPYEEADTKAFLAESGFRFLLVHKRFIKPERLPRQLEVFERMFGAPETEDADVIVYRTGAQR